MLHVLVRLLDALPVSVEALSPLKINGDGKVWETDGNLDNNGTLWHGEI